MQPYANLPPRLPPAVCLADGLADDHRDRSLAVPRDCPRKIKIIRGEKRKIRAVWTVLGYEPKLNNFMSKHLISRNVDVFS